jgi:amidohydrolase
LRAPRPSGEPPVFERIKKELSKIAPQLSVVRRYIHQNPELSGQELSTTGYLSKQLAAARVPHRVGPGKRGVITEMAESVLGPVIAMRADIDALPIQENNQVPYASKHDGVMHACGHDAHAAMLLGATLALHRVNPFPTRWRSIFQPSEEAGRGAVEMIEAGALDGVDAIVALHVDPNLEVGKANITPGPRTAFCHDFTIRIEGRGGHGARPHLTIDPIAAAAHLITLIYQAVPRQTDARRPTVVTIGSIQAGHASNVIPDSARLEGTIRALDSASSADTRETLERLCRAVAQAFGARISVEFANLLPGMVNDLGLSSLIAKVATRVLGSKNVLTAEPPSMGAEDFADYLAVVPGCMIGLGVKRARREPTPLHTATFDIDEAALPIGAQLLAFILLECSKHPEQITSFSRAARDAG